ncbi:type II secretion system GspH family protein [Flavobacterium sp. D11R37]|nr:type II secretion system GspH family protein [Flavobacterium coralii]
MNNRKVNSFTLSEMLVVMIITAIVVGIAFSVLSLVQRNIEKIKNNLNITTELSLFEQRLYTDFNEHNYITKENNKLMLVSDIDTLIYNFNGEFLIRNTDTIPLKLDIISTSYFGNKVENGNVDAVYISAIKEINDYGIFVSKQNDAVQLMNTDGF